MAKFQNFLSNLINQTLIYFLSKALSVFIGAPLAGQTQHQRQISCFQSRYLIERSCRDQARSSLSAFYF